MQKLQQGAINEFSLQIPRASLCISSSGSSSKSSSRSREFSPNRIHMMNVAMSESDSEVYGSTNQSHDNVKSRNGRRNLNQMYLVRKAPKREFHSSTATTATRSCSSSSASNQSNYVRN